MADSDLAGLPLQIGLQVLLGVLVTLCLLSR